MSQKILIDNVKYKISGGKILLGEKIHKIVSGKIRINGKVLKIDFGGKVPVKVFLSGDVYPDQAGVVINGTEYLYGSGHVEDVYAGDSIKVNCNLFIHGMFQAGVNQFIVPDGITSLYISLEYDADYGQALANFTY